MDVKEEDNLVIEDAQEEEGESEFVIEYGTPLLSWEIDEYPNHERSRLWYILGGGFSLVLIWSAVFTANFLFALIILMVDLITIVSLFEKPQRVSVTITTLGVLIDRAFYSYPLVRDFSIAYDPPHVKLLYLDFVNFWHPLVSVPLEDTDPNEVREILLSACVENLERTDETLTDAMRRVYKL